MENCVFPSGIVFRCDFFRGSGLGHLKRCSVLAKVFINLGIEVTLIVDVSPGATRFTDGVKLEVLDDVLFDEVGDAIRSAEYAKSCYASHLVVDSYRITDRWVQLAQSKGLVVFAFDDLNVLRAADIRVNYFPGAWPLSTSGVELIGPQYFVTDLSRQPFKSKKPESVIFHAGANGDFSGSVAVIQAILDSARSHELEIGWLIANETSRTWLESSGWLLKEDLLCDWQVDKAMNWADFDIVVGPPSTSLYEAVMQGALPISYVISDTQNDYRAGWLSIGHACHLTGSDCKSSPTLTKLMSFVVARYSELIDELERNSVDLDGLGTKRVASVLLGDSSQKDPRDALSEPRENSLAIRVCVLGDAENFLLARNAPVVRQLSTSDKEIEWIEHLNWWFDASVERFAVSQGGRAAAYFWHRPISLNGRRYLVGGWFPACEGPIFGVAVKLITWQLQHCASRYLGHVWLATINSENRAVIELNRRLGFVDAGIESRADAERLFPGTLARGFVILERSADT